MNDLERNLLIVLGNFLAVLLLLYICLKICQMVRERKSRHYRNMLREGQEVTQKSGDYVLVTMPPIKPHLFARSYRYKERDYERTECDRENHDSEQPNTGNKLTSDVKMDANTTVV